MVEMWADNVSNTDPQGETVFQRQPHASTGTDHYSVRRGQARDASDSAASLREDVDRCLGSQPILARAVNQFMRETLNAASPFEQGYDVTVVEALEQATKRISPSFVEQPEVEAEVRHTIGDTYNTLGRYDEARPLLETALEIRVDSLGHDSPEAIETMASLAQLAWRQADYDQAVERSYELLEARRRALGDPSSDVAVTLDFLGRVLTEASRYDEAESVIQSALTMSLELHGEESIQVAACYQTQSVLAEIWRQDYARAEELTRKEIEIRRAIEGGDTMESASSLNNLGIYIMYQGRLDEAATILVKLYEAWDRPDDAARYRGE